MSIERHIFKNGSTTFFMSSLFFPRHTRQSVFDLYSFVRTADNYVDRLPGDTDGFYHFRSLWEQTAAGPLFDTSRSHDDEIELRVIKNMLRVSRKYDFDPEWTEAFLNSMQADLMHKKCKTLDDTLAYVYGSAEVIGLMMARLMGLPPQADDAARMQGRAMQFINFIRDINEDNHLQRQYIPIEDLKKFKLPDLSKETATAQTEDFKKCIQLQLERYENWQREAYKGYGYIPKRLRIQVETAADMYNWTASKIKADPIVIYDKKVKPSKAQVICKLLTNTV